MISPDDAVSDGPFLTVAEAATRLRLSTGTVRQLIRHGKLESARVGRRRLISESIIRSLAANGSGTPKARARYSLTLIPRGWEGGRMKPAGGAGVTHYEVGGLPFYEKADLFLGSRVEGKDVWWIRRTTDGVQGRQKAEFGSAHEALAALEADIDAERQRRDS